MHGNSANWTTAQTSLHAWDHLANWGRADRHLPQTGAEFEREKGTRETFMAAFRKGIFSNELAKQSVINEALASVCVLTVSIYFCGSHTNTLTSTHIHSLTLITVFKVKFCYLAADNCPHMAEEQQQWQQTRHSFSFGYLRLVVIHLHIKHIH